MSEISALVPASVIALIPRAITIVGEAVLALESWTSETSVQQQASVLAAITNQINLTSGLSDLEKTTLVQLCTVLLPEVWKFGLGAIQTFEADVVSCWGKVTGWCKK